MNWRTTSLEYDELPTSAPSQVEICRQINAKSSMFFLKQCRTTQPTSTKSSFFKFLKTFGQRTPFSVSTLRSYPQCQCKSSDFGLTHLTSGFPGRTKVIYGNLYWKIMDSDLQYGMIFYVCSVMFFCFRNKCIWEQNLRLRPVFLKIHRVMSHVENVKALHLQNYLISQNTTKSWYTPSKVVQGSTCALYELPGSIQIRLPWSIHVDFRPRNKAAPVAERAPDKCSAPPVLVVPAETSFPPPKKRETWVRSHRLPCFGSPSYLGMSR